MPQAAPTWQCSRRRLGRCDARGRGGTVRLCRPGDGVLVFAPRSGPAVWRFALKDAGMPSPGRWRGVVAVRALAPLFSAEAFFFRGSRAEA